MIILFLTHRNKQCGVKAHGNRFLQAMSDNSSSSDKWIVAEVWSMDSIREAVWYWKPDITIMNYHPSTMPRLEPEKNFSLKTKFVALPHEELTLDGAKNFLKKHTMFEAALWQDPTMFENINNIYLIPRCIPKFFKTKRPDRRDIPKGDLVVKMFGFGAGGKNPEECIQAIEKEFENATIVAHFPMNEHADPDGSGGELMVEQLRGSVTKPGVKVLRSLEMYCGQYMSENDLVQWLADADINLSMHKDDEGTGISSTTDLMMAAGVPFAVNESSFYRHLPNEIKLNSQNTLKDVLNKGIEPWKRLAQIDWSPKSFADGVNAALLKILSKV